MLILGKDSLRVEVEQILPLIASIQSIYRQLIAFFDGHSNLNEAVSDVNKMSDGATYPG